MVGTWRVRLLITNFLLPTPQLLNSPVLPSCSRLLDDLPASGRLREPGPAQSWMWQAPGLCALSRSCASGSQTVKASAFKEAQGMSTLQIDRCFCCHNDLKKSYCSCLKGFPCLLVLCCKSVCHLLDVVLHLVSSLRFVEGRWAYRRE